MWPVVWHGVARQEISRLPTIKVSPSFTLTNSAENNYKQCNNIVVGCSDANAIIKCKSIFKITVMVGDNSKASIFLSNTWYKFKVDKNLVDMKINGLLLRLSQVIMSSLSSTAPLPWAPGTPHLVREGPDAVVAAVHAQLALRQLY